MHTKFATIALASFLVSLGAAPLASGALVAHYTFDSSTSPFADSSGNANHGTASGTAAHNTSVVATGAGSLATNLDGASAGFVSLANESQFDFGSSFTISLFARPTSTTSGNRTLIDKNANFRLRHQTTSLQFFLHTSTSVSATLANAVAADTWTHLAVVVDTTDHDGIGGANDASITFYRNGLQAGNVAYLDNYTAALNNDTPRLGTRVTGSDAYRGYMDDVRIYNTALSAPQIAALVPEPGAALIALSAGGLLAMGRRRRGA